MDTIDARQQATQTYQTIHNQPDDLRTMFARERGRIADAARVLSEASRVLTIGIGSSHHASQVSSWLLRAAGIDALPIHAFDFLHYPEQYPIRPGDAAIIFGHSGTTTFTRQALEQLVVEGVPTIAVGATTAEHHGARVFLRTTEAETSTTYTSSHLCAMAVIAQVAAVIGADFGPALADLPGQVELLLSRELEVWPIAEASAGKRIYAYGAGPNAVTATELMIKVREAAFHTIDGMAAEQFLHGPTVSFNAGDCAVVIHVPGAGQERVAAIAKVNAAMGGAIWTVGSPIPGLTADHFDLPDAPEMISPLLAVVPMQLFASRLAAIQNTNPDNFRRDDPIYAAAFHSVGF
jgi:glucosamine--fructose-6-phosphate aminotransferase (isomerizing)